MTLRRRHLARPQVASLGLRIATSDAYRRDPFATGPQRRAA